MTNQADGEPSPTLSIEINATPVDDPWFRVEGSGSISDAVRIELSIEERNDRLAVVLHGAFATDTVSYTRKHRLGFGADTWHIEFGVRGGTLRLRLIGAEAPLNMRYNPRFSETFTGKRGYSEEHSSSFGSRWGWRGWKLTGEVDFNSRSSMGAEGSTEFIQCSVAASGSDIEPCWIFDSGDPARLLAGAPPGDDPPLAKLKVQGPRISVTGMFAVRPMDFVVRRIHPGEFGGSAAKKKLAVVAQALPELLARRAHHVRNGEIVMAHSSTHFDLGSPGAAARSGF